MKKKTTSLSKKPLTDEIKFAIVEYFLTHKNNTTPVIAKEFGVSAYTVSRLIDDYFKKK